MAKKKTKRQSKKSLIDRYNSQSVTIRFFIILALVIIAAAVLYVINSFNRSSYASGPVYYVSTTGSDSNPGTQAAPFATINQANSVATPGTVVYVEPGTYTSPVLTTASGSATARISYVSVQKWGAQIVASGSGTNTDSTWQNTGDYVDIQGFDISGGYRLGILNRGSYVNVNQNHIHNISSTYCGSSGGAGIDSTYSTNPMYNSYTQNFINAVGLPQPCSYVHGIYMQGSNESAINNIVIDNGGLGIVCYHSCQAPTISNNHVLGNGYGIKVGSSNGVATSNAIVTNNIIYNNLKGYAIYDNGTGSLGTNNVFSNNILYGNYLNSCSLTNGNSCVNTIVKDPKFVNYQSDGSGDYHLTSRSPAIDAGTTVGAPSIDYDGNYRPYGKTYDIGAYEYGSSPATTATPTPTSATLAPTNTPTPTPISTVTTTPTPTPTPALHGHKK